MKALMILPMTAALLLATGAPRAHAAEAPNIVVFVADDMYYSDPGFHGGPVDTPHLDRLAAEGTRLSEFYVHAVCSPTRAAFLTGRYPFRNGMEERSHGNDTAGMLTDERTLAEALRQAGYATAIIGKWHLGNWYKRHLPMQRGFDYQYGLYGALIDYYGKMRKSLYDWHRNEQTIYEEGYSTDLFAKEAEKFIVEHDFEKPLFLYMPFNAVHGPLAAPPELTEKYTKRVDQLHPELRNRQRELRILRYAALESMDAAIGRTLRALERRGELDQTLTIFFNDNGGRRENPPFRGGKGETFEGGVRVPCVWRWPGRIPAGRVADGMVHVVDLYPTLIHIAGGSTDQSLPLDGMDVLKAVTGETDSPRNEVVFTVPGSQGKPRAIAIRRGDYKLVGEALYNVATDPGETTDIAAAHPQRVRTLRQRLDELATQRRQPEEHHKITKLIDRPLLVFGKEENQNPPAWLPPLVRKAEAELERQQ